MGLHLHLYFEEVDAAAAHGSEFQRVMQILKDTLWAMGAAIWYNGDDDGDSDSDSDD